jgi:hypothetical protein
MMDVIEINVIRSQPAQAVIDGVHDVDTRHAGIIRARPHRGENLRRDYHLAPSRAEGLPEHRFGDAIAVAISGIEERDARIQ